MVVLADEPATEPLATWRSHSILIEYGITEDSCRGLIRYIFLTFLLPGANIKRSIMNMRNLSRYDPRAIQVNSGAMKS